MVENSKTAKRPNEWLGRVGIAKDGLEVARQILIVAILLLFVIWPTGLQRSVSTLGLSELNLGIAKLTLAQKSSESVGDAAQRLAKTDKRIETARETLKSLGERANSSEVKTAVDRIDLTLNLLAENNASAVQGLNASLDAQASIIQNASPQDVADSGSWGIVISGDKKLDPDAKNEVATAKNPGYQNVKIYYREDWYRTVVDFSSFTEAQAALPRLRAIPNHGSAYLVNMAKWCPVRKDAGNGTLQCAAS